MARCNPMLCLIHGFRYRGFSGGQQSKIEFARKVFLRRNCPRVLLIDEALGPLDAVAKGSIQGRLKIFCRHSLLLIIHHAEAGANTRCVAPGFFDGEIRLEIGLLTEHPVCTTTVTFFLRGQHKRTVRLCC